MPKSVKAADMPPKSRYFKAASDDAALALSLAKRARELLLGAPGLLYLHLSSRAAVAAV